MRFRKLILLLLAFVLFCGTVLGYGWWHVRTHGSLFLLLYDTSLSRYGEIVKEGVIDLSDDAGTKIITLAADGSYGSFQITYPAEYACHAQERAASRGVAARAEWQACFQRQSLWLAGTAPMVARADIRFGICDLRTAPAQLNAHRGDWFLWWMPLPHMSGKPYTTFSRTFYIDGRTCRVVRSGR